MHDRFLTEEDADVKTVLTLDEIDALLSKNKSLSDERKAIIKAEVGEFKRELEAGEWDFKGVGFDADAEEEAWSDV